MIRLLCCVRKVAALLVFFSVFGVLERSIICGTVAVDLRKIWRGV